MFYLLVIILYPLFLYEFKVHELLLNSIIRVSGYLNFSQPLTLHNSLEKMRKYIEAIKTTIDATMMQATICLEIISHTDVEIYY